MVKEDFHYWDFPEGSDTYNWFREHAMNRRHYDAAQRNYELYWKPLLADMKVGPTLVTNTYKQDQLEREMKYEIDNPWTSSMMGICDGYETEEVITKTVKEVTVMEDIHTVPVNKEMVVLEISDETGPVVQEMVNVLGISNETGPVEQEMVVVEISDDSAEDDCDFGIRLCMSF